MARAEILVAGVGVGAVADRGQPGHDVVNRPGCAVVIVDYPGVRRIDDLIQANVLRNIVYGAVLVVVLDEGRVAVNLAVVRLGLAINLSPGIVFVLELVDNVRDLARGRAVVPGKLPHAADVVVGGDVGQNAVIDNSRGAKGRDSVLGEPACRVVDGSVLDAPLIGRGHGAAQAVVGHRHLIVSLRVIDPDRARRGGRRARGDAVGERVGVHDGDLHPAAIMRLVGAAAQIRGPNPGTQY